MPGAKGAQQSQRSRFDLIDRLRTIHRAVWLVRVVQRNPGIAELVHRLTADSLARVRRIFLAVVFPHPIHDWRNAHKRVLCSGPRRARREVQQGQQAKGGTLVLLCPRQA